MPKFVVTYGVEVEAISAMEAFEVALQYLADKKLKGIDEGRVIHHTVELAEKQKGNDHSR